MTRNGDRASGSRKDGQGSVVPELVVEGVERGWSVIPVRGDKTPCLNSWKRWQGERPTLQQVEAWQRKFNPPAWAVVTGSVSDVIILDFDGAEGRRTCEATGLEPHIQTGSGGYHVYVECPEWSVATLNGKTKRTLGQAYPGLDIRADGGYAIFSGRNLSGPYAQLRELTPEPVVNLPTNLRNLLGLLRPPTQVRPNLVRNVALLEPSMDLIEEALERAPTEGRNNAGFQLAMQLRDLGYSFDVADKVMREYTARVPGVNTKNEVEPYTENAALNSLQQAYSREPRNTFVPYFATETGIFWRKPDRDRGTIVRLTNFNAQITEDVVADDGIESRRMFTLVAALDGRKATFTVPAREFASMAWILERLGAKAVVPPGFGATDHVRVAIQLLSNNVRTSRIYEHTGWRRINGKWFYLHSGGAIGPDGVYDVKVALPRDLSAFNLPEPPSGAALKRAVRASLNILELGPDRVTVPFFSSIYRAAIRTNSFSVHLVGPTGTLKTSTAVLGQQHYGRGFDLQNVPASWSATENSLEALQFIAKDALLLIDDFAPRGTRSDVERWHQRADRVLRGQGNNAGRARMKPDSSLRTTKKARGTTLSTGEDVPKGESLKARLMILELGPDTIDAKRLADCQSDGSSGLFSQAMAAFLSWLAPQYDAIRKELATRVADLRQRAERSNLHRRTPDMVANLMFGLDLFLQFCVEKKILTESEAKELRRNSWEALGLAAAAQAREQRADEPTRRFLDLLSASIVSGECHLKNLKTRQPIGQPRGRCIGWRDGDYLLLEPDVAFAEAQRMAGQQGDTLPIGPTTLWKRLRDKKLLALREKGRNQVKWRIDGSERRVLCLIPSALPMASRPGVASE